MSYCKCGEDKGRCIDCAEEIITVLQETAALLDRSLMKSEARRLELEEALRRIREAGEWLAELHYKQDEAAPAMVIAFANDAFRLARNVVKEAPNEA